MDDFLQKQLEEFAKFLKDKGYQGPYVIAGLFEFDDFMKAVSNTYLHHDIRGFPILPFTVQTTVNSTQPHGTSTLKFKLVEEEEGLEIREAFVTNTRMSGKLRRDIHVSFSKKEDFPSSEQLIKKLDILIRRKSKKCKGI